MVAEIFIIIFILWISEFGKSGEKQSRQPAQDRVN